MIILGIDPGYAIVGYGVLEYNGRAFRVIDYGAITTKAGLDPARRLEMIYDALGELIDKFRPDDVAVEELFFQNNQKTAIMVAEARGVIVLCAKKRGVIVAEYTPLQVKQAVVGYGRAEKQLVQAMVTSILGLKEVPKPDDTADALAIAICHGHTGRSRLAGYYNK